MKTRFFASTLAVSLLVAASAAAQEPSEPAPGGADMVQLRPPPPASAWPAPAQAAPQPARYTPAPAAEEEPRRRAPQWGVGFRIGPHYRWVRDGGLDAFAKDDLLLGFFSEAQLRVVHQGPLSLWALGGWNTGGASGNAPARGLPASLTFHDLHLGLEGRWQVWRRIGLLARVAPGAHYVRAKVTPTSLGHALVSSAWSWSLDATAGASVLLGSIGDDDWPSARFWLTGEVGYGFTGAAPIELRADVDEDERARYGTTILPSLNSSGTLMRFGVGMTF